MWHTRTAPRIALAALVAVTSVSVFSLSPATGAHICADGSLPVHFTPPADPALATWEVEGRIADYSRPGRTITANGITFHVPDGMMVKTNDLAQPVGNIPFADSDPATPDLTDPALEGIRTVRGGTAIAAGDSVFTPAAGGGTCMSLVATSVFVELAEHGLIGLLMSVNEADASFVVGGATIRMNTDPRFPSDLTDIGGNAITVADLVDNLGTLVDIGGYFEGGILRGNFVEAAVLRKLAATDTVVIERAEGRSDKSELRAVGLVSRHPDTNSIAPSVNIYRGAVNASETACTGDLLGSAPVTAADGTFTFRRTVSPLPATVCAQSTNPDGGGVDDIAVITR